MPSWLPIISLHDATAPSIPPATLFQMKLPSGERAIVDIAKLRDSDEHGERYTVDFGLEWGGRRAVVRSAWIVGRGDRDPRLTSCFVLLKGGLQWLK
jgi:hypothetical protein